MATNEPQKGVQFVGPDQHSEYVVAPRAASGGSAQPNKSPAGSSGSEDAPKKRRGRPPKNPDDPPGGSGGRGSGGGRGGGRKPRSGGGAGGGGGAPPSYTSANLDGLNFTPYLITVFSSEDVCTKIHALCKEKDRVICVLSASGLVSSYELIEDEKSSDADTPESTISEGRYNILSMHGCLQPIGDAWAGGLSICLSEVGSSQLMGGRVMSLIAASTVQVVLGSFIVPSDKVTPKAGNDKNAEAAKLMPPPPPVNPGPSPKHSGGSIFSRN